MGRSAPGRVVTAAGNLARRRLALREAVGREALVGSELALAAQHRADGEEIGRRGDVVDAQDARPGVDPGGERRERARRPGRAPRGP